MRKSTSIVMGIIVLGFGGMMVAANVALKPLQRYAAIATEVTSVLKNLEMIEPRSKVFVLGCAGGEKRLASEGWGLLIELEPADDVRQAKGRLQRLAYRAIEEAGALYRRHRDKDLEWFEVKFLFPEGAMHRSLIPTDDALRLGPPEPAFPASRP